MIADRTGLDTNILVYADDAGSRYHIVAGRILADAFAGRRKAWISPQILGEYFAVVTRTGRSDRPLSADEALARLMTFQRSRKLRKVYPRRSAMGRAAALAARLGMTGPRVFDVYYALTLLDNGIGRIVTANARHFVGIPGLAVEDPFA